MNHKNVKNAADSVGGDGMQTVNASYEAYQSYAAFSLNRRREIITSIKSKLIPFVSKIAEMELKETNMGNVKDKVIKLMLAIAKTPDIEDLVTEVTTGDHGMTLYEYSAYGVICTILPGTNPCATLINNTIGMLAAGNAVIHIPNPRCVGVTGFVTEKINEAIYETCGIAHLVTTLPESTMQYATEIMNHPDVAMVVATGGQKMMHHALSCAKKVIGAGQANPVVIVDETADLKKAAKDIVDGASFDNNIMCISEKNLVVVQSAAEEFIKELKKNGVYYISDEEEMLKITKATVTTQFSMNRALEGKSANLILKEAGIICKEDVKVIVVDTMVTHPFFSEEFLMPVISMVQVPDFEEALKIAQFIEQGNRHTAMIHSQSIERLNRAAHEMQTSVFIKNGSSLEAIGLHGEQNTSFTVANVTGEGVTTARHFARRRRCTLTTGFSIR